MEKHCSCAYADTYKDVCGSIAGVSDKTVSNCNVHSKKANKLWESHIVKYMGARALGSTKTNLNIFKLRKKKKLPKSAFS